MHPEPAIQPAGLKRSQKEQWRHSRAPWWSLLIAFSIAFLVACGGGGGGGGGNGGPENGDPDEVDTQAVGGNATKGPLANADVTVFQLDPAAERMRGDPVATGVTNDRARIQVNLPDDVEGLLVIAVEANDNTTDITTDAPPLLGELSTVIRADKWRDGQRVYATPLSHIAVEIAARNVPDDAGVAQTRSALSRAQTVVRETVGLGLLVDNGEPIDLFTTAPILESDAATDDRRRALRYRRATEAIVAVLAEVEGADGNISARFESILEDLADGSIGPDNDVVVTTTEQTNPDDLIIPGTDPERTVGETRDIVNSEREQVTENEDDEVNEATEAEDDAGPSEQVNADSGLTGADLEGAVAELTLDLTPADAGTVTTTDGDPVDGEDGVFEVGVDDTVTVTATASGPDYAFVRWTEDGAQSATTAEFTLDIEDDTPRALTAEFAVGLSVAADPEAGGAPVINGGAGTSASIEPDDRVTVSADTATGFEFGAWGNFVDESGDSVFMTASLPNHTDPEEESYSFDMPDEPTVLIAQYDFIAATSADTEQGVVTAEFDDEGNAVLTAESEPGFVFAGWVDQGGTVVSTDPDGFVFDFSGGDTVTATFEEESLPAAVWGNFNWDEALWQ